MNFRVIDEEGCPIRIIKFQYSSWKHKFEIQCKNISKKNVVSVAVMMLFFDPFNRFLIDQEGVLFNEIGMPIDPGFSQKASWQFPLLEDILENAYTAIAYVSIVRLEGGRLRNTDSNFLTQKIMEMVNVDISKLVKI